jgi:predicted ATPase
LLSHLSVLKDSELLYERGIYPQSTYIFKHSLIQDATYQSLLQSTRQKYHQKIAQVLEKNFPDTMETHPELLAHHYTEAGLVEQAISYWQRAGEIAIGRSAEMEAINHLTKGLNLIESMPENPERNQQELKLQVTLGIPLAATRGFGAPEVGRVYGRARELCQKVGESPRLFPSLFGMWLYYANRELQPAKKIGEQLRTIAQRAQDPELNLQAHHALWTTSFTLGNFVKAREHAEQGMIIYDPQQHRSHAFIYGGHDPGVCCRYFGATAMWFLGYPDQALDGVNEAVSLAQDLSHLPSLAIALVFVAHMHLCRREAKATQEGVERAIALASEHGLAFFLTWATFLRGWAQAAQGKEDEGIAEMRQGLVAHQATGSKNDLPHFLSLLAEAYGEVGQPEEGLMVLVEAFETVSNTGERSWEAELYRRKGELLLQQGQNVGEAEE